MFGLAILAAFAVYVTLLFLAVRWAARRARASGRSPRLWGGAMAAAILLPVFWDWLPTVLVHEYYCRTKTFARVYKSAEQWKAEHPAEAAQIGPVKDLLEVRGTTRRRMLNSRFALDREDWSTALLPVASSTYRIVDTAVGEVVVEANEFAAGHRRMSERPRDWQMPKLWLERDTCGSGVGGLGLELRGYARLDGRSE